MKTTHMRAALVLFAGAATLSFSAPAAAQNLMEGANPGLVIVSGDKEFSNFNCTTVAV